MAPSADIGRVLCPKKTKTHEISEMAMKDPSSGFELSCTYSRSRRHALALQMLGADGVCSEARSHLTDRRHHKDDVLRPHGSVIELDGHSVCGIHRALIPALHPDVTGPVDPCPRWLADFIDEAEVPSVLGDKRRTSYACASGDALKLTRQSWSDAG